LSSKTSTLFTVGTLLRHAQDAGSPVRLLVSGTWLDGTIVGADGLGVILDDGSMQVLVRLDSILAVAFSRAEIDGHAAPDQDFDQDFGQGEPQPRAHWAAPRQPIEAGPVGR
jgi:hypothetical protein